MKYDIFISYRRDGGDTLAQLIYDRLTDRGYSVFLDIESLRSGKFNEKLFAVIDECKDVVVILPPDALERCSNEGDWLFLELTHALQERKNIIPVMMKGFKWPEKLPEGLEELQHFNGIQDSKDYFDAVIDKITTLLQSRPVLFGSVRKKLNKKKHHINIRAKVKKRKKLLIGLAIMALAVAAVLYTQKANKEQQLQESAENVDIMIYPGDDMNASEYYDAQEMLRQRLDILADGQNYEYSANDDIIHVQMPKNVFHEISPETILKSYITRPTKLSIIGGSSDGKPAIESIRAYDAVDVSRDDIRSVEKKTGTGEEISIARLDTQSYKIEEADEYQYIEITLSDEVCSKIKEVYGECELYYLGQDVEEMDRSDYYYFYMLASDSPNTFYIVDIFQEYNISSLLEFNYQQEPFASSFRFNYTLPVEWEVLSEVQDPGKGQCDIWDMEEPYITMQFECLEDEVKEGEMQDYMSSLKKRLDTLNVSYAIGKTVEIEREDCEYGFTIRTGTEHLGAEIINLLVSSQGLSVKGMYYDVIDSYNIADLEYEKQDDGTYQFSLILNDDFDNDWNMEAYETALAGITASESQDIYLIADNKYRLAKADVSEDIDGTKITFDNLYYLGLDTITEDNLYLLDFLTELAQTSNMTSGYTAYYLNSYRIDGQDTDSLGVTSIYSELLENTEEAIHAVYPEAIIGDSYDINTLDVSLSIEADENFPEKANEAIQTIYRLSGVATNERDAVSVMIDAGGDKEGGINISIESDNYEHCMQYHGSYFGENIKMYQDEFARIMQTDPFYTKTITIDEGYENAWNYNYD